jgi:class 3 adenylate cyclase
MEQDVRFCTAADGVRIAYATIGDGPPLVWLPGWFSHLELDMGVPPIRDRIERLSKDFTLVRFDNRGTGLSQRGIDEFSLDSHVLDVEAVVAELGIEEFALVGYSGGGPIAIKFADGHPDAVTHLVLIGTFARPGPTGLGSESQAVMSIIKNEWGLGTALLAELMFGESADPVVQRGFAVYQRQASTAEDAFKSMEAFLEMDVSDLLPGIKASTLVLHGRDDRASPIENGLELAAGIKGARFLSVEGPHVPNRKQSAQMDNAIREFILDEVPEREASSRYEPATPGGVVTILFTDMEASTALTQRLGDERGREVLRGHERITREVLDQHGGNEVKTMGDGFMVSFGSVTRAIDCAIALQRAFADHNASSSEPLKVRVGLNAGEPIEEDGDLFGSTVIMASRIAAKAGAGEILIPEPLRHLLTGKSYVYADRGETMLKGFEDAVRLFEVRWRE